MSECEGDVDQPSLVSCGHAYVVESALEIVVVVVYDDLSTGLILTKEPPARSIAVARRGPNGPNIEKETTHDLV